MGTSQLEESGKIGCCRKTTLSRSFMTSETDFKRKFKPEDPDSIKFFVLNGYLLYEGIHDPCHRSNQKQPLRVESKAATLRRVFHNGFRFLIKSSLGFAMLNRSAPATS